MKKKFVIYDIETDGLLDDVTKIHCLSYSYRNDLGDIITSTTYDYDKIIEFFKGDFYRIGHNITLYDERVVKKLTGFDTDLSKDKIIDTLPLSWYLYPSRKLHGLESWGGDLGVTKPTILDWKNLSYEDYKNRCETDTVINLLLWERIYDYLKVLYSDDIDEIFRLISYLQFKMDCIKEQEEVKLRVDLVKLKENIQKLSDLKEAKVRELKLVMPKVPIFKKRVYKNAIKVSDKEVYEQGDLMFNHYASLGYEVKERVELNVIKGHKEPNPNSSDQKKDWLFSLGWTPTTFKTVKEEDGSERKIPQINSSNTDGVCDSVKALFEIEPKLELLQGLSVLSHRIGLLEGIEKNQKDGFIECSALGFTNTLRLRHTNVVNLPGVFKPYGKECREIFIANEGHILCGSDMSALEDTTKQHYMYFYDPEYVQEMRIPGFDPHLDIAELSGLMTKSEIIDHKLYDKTNGAEGKSYKSQRNKAKIVNFSSVYGASPAKIASTINIPLREAQKLHKAYWNRNNSVKKAAESFAVKEVNEQKWLFNPISKFWYSLRAEKDRFSTCNQSSGVYCFDQQVKGVRKRGIKISLQMHDEILFNLLLEDKDKVTNLLKESIKDVNEEIKLNVPLSISMDYGNCYSDCH